MVRFFPGAMVAAGQVEELDRDVLFPRLLLKPENRRCFDCNKANPKWCSWRFGVLICMDCAALHRWARPLAP